jgi:uncharacterized membrane protein
MEFLGPFHPQIVHTPIVMLVFSPLFMLIGRFTDSAWWRKAAFAMLVIGVVGSFLAWRSGDAVGERVERAGVPESAVDAHEDMGKVSMYLAGGALLLLLVSMRVKKGKGAIETVALLLQIGAAVTVGIAGHRGGILVYDHGANVKATHPTGALPAMTDSLRREIEEHEKQEEQERR